MKMVTKVLVGSRLHNLHKEDSDFDYRGIHLHGLKDFLSPFTRSRNTNWIEGKEDNTSYELAGFCKQATKGNATILEVFFSDQIIETTPVADKMRNNWQKFMDTNQFILASRGYAHNQYNKMQLFEDEGKLGQSRTPKFAVAYMRVLWQCARFLETGEFHCQIDEPEWHDYIYETKWNFNYEKVPELTEKFMQLQRRITDAQKTAPKMKPDIKWIEEFIYEAYTSDNM